MGGIAPLALSAEHIWEILTECWIVLGLPWAGGFWFEVWGINLECGLSQLIYNQRCLLFWNLWCFVSGLYFINIFQKIWILSSRNRFIQEQNEWIISTLPSFHLSKFWLHDKFIKYFWDHGNFWETIVNFYSFPSRLGLIKKLHSSFKISTLRVFEYYDGVIFLVAHCMRQNTSKNVSMFEMFEMSANLCLLNFVTTSFRERGTLVMRNLTGTKR